MSKLKDRKGRKGKNDVSGAVTLPETPSPQLLASIMSPSDKKMGVAKMMIAAMHTGIVIDTKIFAFSRRRSVGGVDTPMPIYTNSSLLMAGAPHFVTMLGGGFAEDRIAPLDEGFPTDKQYLQDMYDYDSDSDLDSEDEHEGGTLGALVLDDKNEGGSSSHATASARKGKQPENSESASTKIDGDETSEQRPDVVTGERYGRIITPSSGAYKTWQALVSYLYTGDIKFAPLKSRPNQSHNESGNSLTPHCSPKSMYRLAHAYGVDVLKKKAEEGIKAQLTADNIVLELRSSLTAMYPDIQKMEVTFACEAAQLPRVLTGLSEWIDDLANGEGTHTASSLKAVVQQIGAKPPEPETKKPHCARCNASYPQRNFSCSSCGQYGQF